MAALEEGVDEVGAEEARRSGDEDAHGGEGTSAGSCRAAAAAPAGGWTTAGAGSLRSPPGVDERPGRPGRSAGRGPGLSSLGGRAPSRDASAGGGHPAPADILRPMARRRPHPLLLPAGFVALLLASPTRAEDEEPAPAPGLRFDKMEHDFGRVGQEQDLEAEFQYRNEGTVPVSGLRGIGDCGCYGVSLSKADLAPGEGGVLKVQFRTLLFSGRVVKRLKVLAKEGLPQPITLKLAVDVVTGVILDPGRIWFGDVLVGSSPAKTVVVKWHAEAGQPFRVTSVEVPGYDFAISTADYEEGPWKGTAITFAFKEAPPLGMFSATALLRTDHPDHPRISVPVTANVTGRVWVQSRTVYFGWVTKGQGKATTLLVKPFSPEVDLGEVTAASRAGKVKVSMTKNPGGRSGWWEIKVEVPPDAPEGKIDDVLEIRTRVPGEEVTAIEVRGEVVTLGG